MEVVVVDYLDKDLIVVDRDFVVDYYLLKKNEITIWCFIDDKQILTLRWWRLLSSL
jgi:hypothetical protein